MTHAAGVNTTCRAPIRSSVSLLSGVWRHHCVSATAPTAHTCSALHTVALLLPLQPAAGQPYGNMTGMVQMQGYPTAAPAGVMGQQQQPAYTQPYPYTPYNSQGPAAAQPFAQQPQDVPITRY